MATYRVEFRQILHGNQLEFGLSFNRDLATDPSDVAAFAAVLQNWYADDLAPYLSNDILLTDIFFKRVDASGIEQHNTASLPVAGAGVADALPNQVAMVVSLYSATYTRRGRGRCFLGGIGAAGLAEGLWNAATLGYISTAFMNLSSFASPADDWQWCVWSEADATGYEVVAFAPQPVPGGINKRRIGRGS